MDEREMADSRSVNVSIVVQHVSITAAAAAVDCILMT